MKKLIPILFVFFLSFPLRAQEKQEKPTFPSEYGTFSIPLWTKAVLEIKENESGSYDYRILSMETYEDYYSFDHPVDVFSKNPKPNTIDLLFVGAYNNEGKEDKDYKTLLKLRNNSKVHLNYKADILYYFSDTFENTSVVGMFPNTDVQEIWGHKIDEIALYDFEAFSKN